LAGLNAAPSPRTDRKQHVPIITAYHGALTRLRELLGFYVERPRFIPHSREVEAITDEVARAARRAGISIITLSSVLSELAAEILTDDIEAAVKASRAMVRWAAQEYADATGPGTAHDDA
jgi:hypothetical protein